MAKSSKSGGTGPSLKGKGPYPASKQTNKPVGVSRGPGKAPPTQTSKPRGAPKGG